MFSTLVKVALFAPLAIQGVLAGFAVNTPEFKQCESAKISWEATKGPYNIIVVSAANPCGDALADLGDFTTTFTNWPVAIAAGAKVQISVVDADDDEAWSGNITVAAGTSSACLSTSSSSSSSSSSTSSSSTTSSSTDSNTSSDDGSGDDGVSAVGAANAGTNPFSNAAVSAQQFSKPALFAVAFAALAMAL